MRCNTVCTTSTTDSSYGYNGGRCSARRVDGHTGAVGGRTKSSTSATTLQAIDEVDWDARSNNSSKRAAVLSDDNNDKNRDDGGDKRSKRVRPSTRYVGVGGWSPYLWTKHPPSLTSMMRAGHAVVTKP